MPNPCSAPEGVSTHQAAASADASSHEASVSQAAPVPADMDGFCRQLLVAVEQSPVAIAITDVSGRIQFANRCYVEITGYELEELLGRTPAMIQSGETPEQVYRELWGAILGGRVWEGELLNRRKSGEAYWAREVITPVRGEQGRLVNFVAVKEDITERRRQQKELSLLATVFETGQATLITDAEMRIEKVNQAFTDITGYSAAEVVGHTPRLFKSGHHGRDFYAQLWEALHATGHWQGEIWNRNRSGEVYPLWQSITAVYDDGGRVRNYVAMFHNISERKRLEQELERQASRDHLTGAFNRRAFDAALHREIAQAQRSGSALALLMLDLDHFKEVNDRHGHDVGDEALRRVAQLAARSLRSTDLLARWGGEEFVILLPGADGQGAHTFAERLRTQIAESRPCGLSITVSIGISAYRPADEAETMLSRADTALYRAKRSGRNSVVIAGEPAPGEEVLW